MQNKWTYCKQNYNFELLDTDETSAFKYYNDISIDAKNNIDYYETDKYYLYQVKEIYQDTWKGILKGLKNL